MAAVRCYKKLHITIFERDMSERVIMHDVQKFAKAAGVEEKAHEKKLIARNPAEGAAERACHSFAFCALFSCHRHPMPHKPI